MARLRPSRRQSRTARATSAGGIVIRHLPSGPEVLLGKRRRERDGATWTLPKGTPDGAESVEQTALREVVEETGIQVRILAPVGPIEYYFTQDGRRVHKTVHYFLMEPLGGDLGAHDHEFDEVRWVPLGRAREIMTFPTERGILEQALPLAGVA
ncbi:MAG TPA: NUDIX hydrolase [Candidatus Limnocylindria bacterium]|nr:NUDIX hydrolase [Candidatus Limnocylindria bacterium]